MSDRQLTLTPVLVNEHDCMGIITETSDLFMVYVLTKN